jgi:hypothetical protein
MKSFVRSIALFSVVVAFGAVAASAQINYGADVNIPFQFNIGEKTYEAGKYTVKINKQMVLGAALIIQKVGSDETQTILLSNGGGSRSGDVELVFNSADGRKFLTGITTSNNAFALITRKADTRVAELQKCKNSRL